jgi:MoaA/NifB/PqqE/SkfB family radical SAM enzyme
MESLKMNHILFPITYDCNLNCEFCVAKCNKTTKINIESSVRKIIEQKEKVEWVYITGGEPFLVDTLFDVCDELKNEGFKVGVTTNGTFYKPEIVNHVDRIGISLDGTKEYHDNYRGYGVFDKAINLFNEVKDKCETVIMSVAFKENLNELKKIKFIVEQLNPTYWQIQRDINDPDLNIPKELQT